MLSAYALGAGKVHVEITSKRFRVRSSEIAELKTALPRQAETLDKVTARLNARHSKDRLVDNR